MNTITDKEIKHAFENPQWLKDNYPKAFECELEVGKWYRFKSGTLGFFQGIGIKSYGFHFDGNEWINDNFWFSDANLKIDNISLATPKEVETALINEAKKRGFKKGVFINRDKFKINDGTALLNSDTNFKLFGNNNNLFQLGGYCIFEKGIWAEIIPQEETYIKIPLSYIQDTKDDKELVCLVRNIAENY